EVLSKLARLPYEELGFAKIDHHRSLRTGLPEVIYGAGKTSDQILAIFERLSTSGVPVLITRTPPEAVPVLLNRFPDAKHNPVARTVAYAPIEPLSQNASVAVVAAGTSDLPVAEEAAVTLEVFGARAIRIVDVGVAGLHRLLAHRDVLAQAQAVIVCAGMEGALPSAVAGLVSAPVIAVPTSVGYGASFGGLAALLGMLNSCAPNVAVMNIDNGFGAGCFAATILRTARGKEETPIP
ncbi:MAG: nickel pincer cofactor biosynthesis protein LarB, partial [Verrucomicrobia bacterium]|nr:nickel pincer cofactor biosynthesis protein LarB [Verrucomicrobiota bacterium]